jgi:hypothetical protein
MDAPGRSTRWRAGWRSAAFPMALTLTAWMSCWAGAKGYAAGPGARLVQGGVPDDLELLDQATDEWHNDGKSPPWGTRPTYSSAL